MSNALLVALLVGAGIAALAFVILLARKHDAAARREFPKADRLDSGALFFGQKSRGAAQMRGNGTLVLTDATLVFKQWVVGRTFRIPLASIVAIERPRSFLGKSQLVELLCVKFRDDAGKEDAMAWRVRDLAGWIETINTARGHD